jgi:transmembrane sensor
MNSNSGADWVVKMRSGALDERERQEMRRWMAASPDNARDLLRAEAAWRLSGALQNELDIQRELHELDSCEYQRHSRRRRWMLSAYAAAAALAILAVGIAAWQRTSPSGFQTAHGEQRIVTLADGSTVALNTDTHVTIGFSSKARDVFLKSGEALFQVAPDPNRPFTVHAATGHARALGTRFNVLAQDDDVTVSVLEGRVEVSPASRGSSKKLLDAGESTAYDSRGTLMTPEPTRASAERIVAWREGKLRFESLRLDHAVREYNRYAKKPIRLEIREAGNVEISGVFRIGDSVAFVHALGELVNAQVVDEGEILILK